MGDTTTDELIVATRFSRVACAARSGGPATAEVIYHESLAALAESLEMLAKIIAAFPMVEIPDLAPVHQLSERVARLISAVEPHISTPNAGEFGLWASCTDCVHGNYRHYFIGLERSEDADLRSNSCQSSSS